MFRKVSAPKWPVSEVIQDVIMSVSKTPSLTFLHSDTGSHQRHQAGWELGATGGRGGGRAILQAEQMKPPGRGRGRETERSSLLPPSDTSEHPGDNACERVLVHTQHTHVHTPTAHSHVYTHMCTHTQTHPHIERRQAGGV